MRGPHGLNPGEHWGGAFTMKDGSGNTLGCLPIVDGGEAWNGTSGVCANYIKAAPRCPVGSAGDFDGKICTRYVGDIHTSPKSMSAAIAAMSREEIGKALNAGSHGHTGRRDVAQSRAAARLFRSALLLLETRETFGGARMAAGASGRYAYRGRFARASAATLDWPYTDDRRASDADHSR